MLAPCDLTSTLTLTSGDDGGGTQVTVDVGDMVFTVSPATVRLVLGVLKPLQQDQVCTCVHDTVCNRCTVLTARCLKKDNILSNF